MGNSNLFGTLDISSSGLRVAQVQVDVTGKNVANANDDHYTRQRVISQALPASFADGRHIEYGSGVKSVDITRVFDEFIYSDYRESLSEKEYASYIEDKLKQISDFFPELAGYGIAEDMRSYFDAWSNLSANPNEPASKITLVKVAKNLTRTLKQARENLINLQDTLNKEVKSYVDEINYIAKEIAGVNREILLATERQKAPDRVTIVNELRDRRDSLELGMAKLVSLEIDRQTIETDNHSLDEGANAEAGEHYVLNIGGFNIVDGVDSSTIISKSDSEADNLYNVKYVRQDEKEFNINSYIKDGKLGALLRLRGSSSDLEGGQVGYIQEYINELDKFTQGFVNATNSTYAKAKSSHFSTKISASSQLNIQNGSFFVNMFDINDSFVGQKEIFIGNETKMEDIVRQINSNTDDNADGSAVNDISDKFRAGYIDGVFVIAPKADKGRYFISIDDGDTNFAGAVSLKKFFTGDNSKNIDIDIELLKKPEDINAYILTKEGKTLLGNSMAQLQNKEVQFYEKGTVTDTVSLGDYYNNIMSILSNDTKVAIENNRTKEVTHQAVKAIFDGIGKVSVDEELVNLMKFQAGYVANAKVLTTIDEMINTLLGIKQ